MKITITKYGRMTADGKREVTHPSPEEAFPAFVPPFKVEQYFASDSYYFEVQDSNGRRVTDYDDEKSANWMRDYMDKGGDLVNGLQKWCSDCSGSGRAFGLPCQMCGGKGMLP